MPSVKLDRPFAIRQRISAGGNFNATEPPGAPSATNQVFKFATAATGGKIDLSSSKYDVFEDGQMYELDQMELKLGGQSSWKLEKVNDDGDLVTVLSGTTEASTSLNPSDRVLVHKTESLALTTVGATAGMVATLWFKRHQGL